LNEVTGKLTRIERNQEMKRRLFRAASQIVGQRGYAQTSIARITELAGVAQGTFYTHFANRQALLDELLPTLGLEMVKFIQDRTETIRPESARETARFRAFFDFLAENPGFLRVLNEAEFAAPEAFHRHIANITAPYQRILQRARKRGELRDFDDAQIEAVVHILIGARGYLSQRYGRSMPVDAVVFRAYAKLLQGGLFPTDTGPLSREADNVSALRRGNE
jgi:AcrR family transcriptional regulator